MSVSVLKLIKGDAMKLTQLVLIQLLQDEFDILTKTPKHLPGPPEKELLSKGELLTLEEEKIYRLGVGKLLFLMRYSRLDVLNSVRELRKHMTDGSTTCHINTVAHH